jgi:hypothetical protein
MKTPKEILSATIRVRLTQKEKEIISQEFADSNISITQFFRQHFLPLIKIQAESRKKSNQI